MLAVAFAVLAISAAAQTVPPQHLKIDIEQRPSTDAIKEIANPSAFGDEWLCTWVIPTPEEISRAFVVIPNPRS